MTKRIYESMTRIPLIEYDPGVRRGWNPKVVGCVRVWRSEASMEAACTAQNTDIHDAVEALGAEASRADIIAAIEQLDRIEAIEVLDECGNGALLYPAWGD